MASLPIIWNHAPSKIRMPSAFFPPQQSSVVIDLTPTEQSLRFWVSFVSTVSLRRMATKGCYKSVKLQEMSANSWV